MDKVPYNTFDSSQIPYYDGTPLVTKNRVLNVLIGPRGNGKTYWFKRFFSKRGIKGKGKFIYLRRKVVELDNITDFFDDIRDDPELEGYLFMQKGNNLYAALDVGEDEKPEWVQIGSMYALASNETIKSKSYSDYDRMLFDEWLPLNPNGFLKNEVETFYSVLDTVFRDRDFQVFLVGNSSILYNPYFEAFNIYPNISKEFTYSKEKPIAIQVIDSPEWSNYRKQTALGQLISGTDYEEYANNNAFEDNSDNLVEDMNKEAKNIIVIKLDGSVFGIWRDEQKEAIYFSDKFNSSVKYKYTFDFDDIDNNFMSYKNFYDCPHLFALRIAQQNNKIFFTTKRVKALVRPIVSKLGLL